MQNCSIYEIISICKNIQITSFISSAPFLGPSLFSFSTKFNFAKTEAIVCDVNAAPGRYCLLSPLLLILHPWSSLLRHNDSDTAWKYPGLKTFSVIFQNIYMTRYFIVSPLPLHWRDFRIELWQKKGCNIYSTACLRLQIACKFCEASRSRNRTL